MGTEGPINIACNHFDSAVTSCFDENPRFYSSRISLSQRCPTQSLPNITAERPVICSNSLCSRHMVTNALLQKNPESGSQHIVVGSLIWRKTIVYLCKSTRTVILYLPVPIFDFSASFIYLFFFF